METNGAVRTEAVIRTEVEEAIKGGKWTELEALAKELKGFAAAALAAERKAKEEALASHTLLVSGIFQEVVALFTAGQPPDKASLGAINFKLKAISGLELELADGVWYQQDFAEGNLVSCRLLKEMQKPVAPKTARGSAAGRKYPSTVELLQEFGDTLSDVEGMTWKEKNLSNSDGNFHHFQVREPLLVLKGLIPSKKK